MVKLKLKDVVDHNFQLALKKLSEAQVTASAAWSLVKISKKTDEQVKLFEEVRSATIKKFASLKEDGSIEQTENGLVVFKSDADKEAAVQEIEALLEQEVEVPTFKLSQLADAKVEARVLALLDKVITE